MSQMRTIEIDFEVHKRIEMERTSFAETPNAVLRRLLKIDQSNLNAPAVKPEKNSGVRHWSGKGVILPHGTEVRMEYNGRVYSGKIFDGQWVVEGNIYNSPSGAASGEARTKAGKPTKLDGWRCWDVKRPGDTDWIAINTLRRAHQG